MPYSITGLIIKLSECDTAQIRHLPLVELKGGLGLIPLENQYILLKEGSDTARRTDFDFNIPAWLKLLTDSVSCAAYIEASISGGEGMQASINFSKSCSDGEPLISSRAINYALCKLSIDDESTELSVLDFSEPSGKDPFDMVGLGRCRSVEGWLEIWEKQKS